MDGIGGSPNDAVKQAASASQQARQSMDSFRSNPEKETGLSRDEIARRQQEAQAPRKHTTDTGKVVDVKSSTRMQQIMQKGMNKIQQDRKRAEIEKKMTIVKKARWAVLGIGLGIVGYLFSEFLYPQYSRVQERNYKLKYRQEMAEKRMQEYLAKQQSEGSATASK